jgi:hypothetical protein
VIDLGKRDKIFGADLLRDLDQAEKLRCFAGHGWGRPIAFPKLREGDSLICGYDQGLGERLFVCDSLDDMQTLYNAYAGGGAFRVSWYTGEDVGSVAVIPGRQE